MGGEMLRHETASLEELRGVDFAVIGLDGLRHDDGGRVAALDGLCRGGDGAGHVARVESHEAEGHNGQGSQDADYTSETIFFFVSHSCGFNGLNEPNGANWPNGSYRSHADG